MTKFLEDLYSLKSLVCLLFHVKESTSFTWNTTLWFSFNHIISLIHPPIGKLKALAHKFSISWEMCAHDWLSMPNLHHYQLWPSLAEMWLDNRCTQPDSRSEAAFCHLLMSLSFCSNHCFISNKEKRLFNHLKRHRWHATMIRVQVATCRMLWLYGCNSAFGTKTFF